MMGKKRNYKSGSDKSEQVNAPLDSEISPLVEEMATHLKNGDFKKAANLFMMGQTRGIFAGDHTLIEKLVKVVGKNATDKLVTAFAHYPCQFCKKGRLKCQNCAGHGYIDYDTVCEHCLGLGAARCDFCDGSGWMAMEDIPEGLRITVFVKRAQTALRRLKLIFARPVPRPLKDKPFASLKRCAQLLIDLDRYMGVLENVLTMAEKLNVPEPQFKNKINKIIQLCVEAAVEGKKYVRELVNCMANSAQLELKVAEKGSASQKLAEKRAEFYERLADKSDILVSLSDEHPLLEKAIRKYASKKFGGKD